MKHGNWFSKDVRYDEFALMRRYLVVSLLLVLMTTIFDTFSVTDGASALLDCTAIVYLSLKVSRATFTTFTIICGTTTILTYFIRFGVHWVPDSFFRRLVSVFGILVVFLLELFSRSFSRELDDEIQLLDLTYDAIFVCDPSGAVTYWNDGAKRIFGWSAEQAMSQPVAVLLGPNFHLAELTQNGRWEGVLRFLPESGDPRWIYARSSLSQSTRGGARNILVASTDTTAARNAHLEVLEQEARYVRIFKGTPVAILTVDFTTAAAECADLRATGLTPRVNELWQKMGHTRLIDANASALRIFQAEDALSLAAESYPLFLPKDLETLACLADSLIDRRSGFSYEETYTNRKGVALHLHTTITFSAAQGGLSEALVSVMDVTLNHLAEERLFAAQSIHEAAMRMSTLGELTTLIAHEINQPLTAIRSNVGAAERWVQRGSEGMAEAEAALKSIVQDSDRATKIIKRIQGVNVRTTFKRAPFRLESVFTEVIGYMHRELRKDDIEVETDLDMRLPIIDGDRNQIEQVVLNLLINATHAASVAPRGERHVTLRAYSTDLDAVVEVSDSGPGFCLPNIDHIFLPFFTTKTNGMGLGLSICQSIVESHGGRVWAKNRTDGGATVGFTLPIQA